MNSIFYLKTSFLKILHETLPLVNIKQDFFAYKEENGSGLWFLLDISKMYIISNKGNVHVNGYIGTVFLFHHYMVCIIPRFTSNSYKQNERCRVIYVYQTRMYI